jgi:uncharacterized ion transporter superfamily protein YfcC
MFVNLAWPRAAVYDVTGKTWWLQWSAALFIALTLVVGFAIHLRNRNRNGSMTFIASHPNVLVADIEGRA